MPRKTKPAGKDTYVPGSVWVPCPNCGGTGTRRGGPCPLCEGAKRIKATK